MGEDHAAKARELARDCAQAMADEEWETGERSLEALIREAADRAWEVDALIGFEDAYSQDEAERVMALPGVEGAFKSTFVQVLSARLRG